MHPTIVVAAACLAVSLAKVLIITHHFAVPTLTLPVSTCRAAPSAVLHLGTGPAPELHDLPSALDGVEVVLVVDDGVSWDRVVKTLDALVKRRATIVLEGRDSRCRR